MSSLTKTWECDIWPHTLRLRLGKQVITSYKRTGNESLDESIATILRQRLASLPWRDSVVFHLDTDDLVQMVQPWLSGVTTPQELLRLSHINIGSSKSTVSQHADWLVRFESAGWQQSALVAGLQLPFWERLRTLAKRECLRFRGVATPFQPLLKYCGPVLPETALFITLGPHHSRVASRVNNAWREVNILSLPQQELHAQLRVITRLSGISDSPSYVMIMEECEPQIVKLRENEI